MHTHRQVPHENNDLHDDGGMVFCVESKTPLVDLSAGFLKQMK